MAVGRGRSTRRGGGPRAAGGPRGAACPGPSSSAPQGGLDKSRRSENRMKRNIRLGDC